ncbi:MAG: aryl-sulfate sulfotransferase [Planctomycetota bacterium]
MLLERAALALAVLVAPQQDQRPEPKRGLIRNEPEAMQGYTLIAPLQSLTVYLVDMEGRVVHQWLTRYAPGSEYLLPNGNLLRCSREPNAPRFKAGGACGRLQEIAWDGSVVWDWAYADDKHWQHHDLSVTPDGTILFIAWELKQRSEAFDAGRAPQSLSKEGLWADSVIEVQPSPPSGADIIWEWRVWDHLIQDRDPERKNFGKVAEHPELIDINADLGRELPSDEEVAKLKQLGYVGGAAPGRGERQADWLHMNAIDYNAELDQIVVSSPHMNEVWILDHSTTIGEAASHQGGNGGRGGDLLYRWGNPRNYRAGAAEDRQLFYQHNARFIRPGLSGAGNLLIFNNGAERASTPYSSVIELVLPGHGPDGYARLANGRFGPESPVWEYTAPDKASLFSSFISGAQRLPNGNTLICEGQTGRVIEVTRDGKVVWEYLHTLGMETPALQGRNEPPNALFRATRIPRDHPGLAGKDLSPKHR